MECIHATVPNHNSNCIKALEEKIKRAKKSPIGGFCYDLKFAPSRVNGGLEHRWKGPCKPARQEF